MQIYLVFYILLLELIQLDTRLMLELIKIKNNEAEEYVIEKILEAQLTL